MMPSLIALNVLRNGSRLSQASKTPRQLFISYRGCSSCEFPPPAPQSEADVTPKTESNATVTRAPPTPKVDHRRLGVDQDLFTASIYSPGSPLFLPHGAQIFNKLVAFLRAQYSRFGFKEVITPTIYKKSLWENSGHWQNYAEDMFSVTGRGAERGDDKGEDEEYGLKPMNCPGHCLLFKSKQRGFRDLPIRYADFGPLHRNEISGALGGLTRVRRFHQDDGHIFCSMSQVGEEISGTLDFVKLTYETFDLGPYRLALSTRPKEHSIGTVEEWDNAELALRQALDASGQVWSVNEGEGAFYGPKIDIILKDSLGKEHQTATIQLDFQLPKRFNLKYQISTPDFEQRGLTATNPEMSARRGFVRPVMIHRAVLGSIERFMALLIEHYNSRWPFWLNPQQVIILAVTNDQPMLDYAQNVLDQIQGEVPTTGAGKARELNKVTFAVDIDASGRTLGKKVSEAKRKTCGIIVVVGKADRERGNSVTVDFRGIPDPRGILRQELQAQMFMENAGPSTAATQSKGQLAPDPLRAVQMTPQELRQILLFLEREYM